MAKGADGSISLVIPISPSNMSRLINEKDLAGQTFPSSGAVGCLGLDGGATVHSGPRSLQLRALVLLLLSNRGKKQLLTM